MVLQNYQKFIEMTSNMIDIVALGLGFNVGVKSIWTHSDGGACVLLCSQIGAWHHELGGHKQDKKKQDWSIDFLAKALRTTNGRKWQKSGFDIELEIPRNFFIYNCWLIWEHLRSSIISTDINKLLVRASELTVGAENSIASITC